MLKLPRKASGIAEAPAVAFYRAARLILCAGALTGCGDIAFKRGSGPEAFAADRQICQTRNPDPTAVRACLSEAGWNIADLDPAAPPASASSAATARVPPTPAPGATPKAPPPSTASGTLRVGSWWKIGAGAGDLQSAADSCLAKLGPANAPDAGYHIVTRELYQCLRDSGWHGWAH